MEENWEQSKTNIIVVNQTFNNSVVYVLSLICNVNVFDKYVQKICNPLSLPFLRRRQCHQDHHDKDTGQHHRNGNDRS